MNSYNYEVNLESLPFDLEDCSEELGILKNAIFKCPGIYYLTMYATENHLSGLSLYVVLDEAPIPAQARTYGMKIPSHPELLVFIAEEDKDFSYKIIEYEIEKFYVVNGTSEHGAESLHTQALFGMEVCPGYFGTFPAPTMTPWGYTTRYMTIIPGIFWIETDQCKVTLAMSQVFRDDISEEILSLSELTLFDREHEIDKTMGYYFFQEKIMCLAIFELMLFNCGSDWKSVDERALMNAIWENYPEYAVQYNSREQKGLNDSFGMVMRTIDPDYELHGSIDDMIVLTPDAGVDFLRFT